ncbi:MAG: hypothetical protein JJT78_09600, partial [Leptospira sp.]|nr:hypothetical protein [Leptospira sp.]
RSFRPQESDRNTFPITNFTGKNIYKKLNDENLLMGYINNSGLNLQLSIAANLSQVEEGGSPMISLVSEGSLSGAEDFGQNDWLFFSDGSLFVLQSDHIDNTYRLVRGIGNYLGPNDINEMEEVANFSFVSEREFLNQINLEVQGIQLEDRKLIIAHSRASDGFLPFRTHVFVSLDDLNWQEVFLPELDGSQNKNYIPFLGFRTVLEGNTLHVYYVINSGPPLYQRISTQDGFNWTLPKQVRFFK